MGPVEKKIVAAHQKLSATGKPFTLHDVALADAARVVIERLQ